MGLYWILYIVGEMEQWDKCVMELGGGPLSWNQVADNYKQYLAFFKKQKEIDKTNKVSKLVDTFYTFYNLVIDIYEWGWGQRFHFAPALHEKSHKEETHFHEERVADLLSMKPGDWVLDAGCGMGGLMWAIVAHSGANIVGITINDYQVERTYNHNKKVGLDRLYEVVCDNFLNMPFADNEFDAVYSIEVTCHAPELQDVYSEIYRVLKPGHLYVTYEDYLGRSWTVEYFS